jgi:hypothetical protein
MSIKFICSCGKHLRARDEMAARRSMCPRCGAPVGVPSLRPTHTGTIAAPLTPQERRLLRPSHPVSWPDTSRAGSDRVTALTPNGIASPSLPSAEPPRRARKVRRRGLEQHWYQCLAYPFLNWVVLLALAQIVSVALAGVVLGVQTFPSFSLTSRQSWLPWSCSALLVMLIVSYTYATVECALASALAGEGPGCYCPGWSAGFPLKSGVRWLVCFFAGPIVPAGAAAYFWIYGGDLTTVDWVILAELGVLTGASWFLAIVSANERNRLRDANPLRVAQLVARLKFRALVPLVIAPALAIAHVRLGVFALMTLHEQILFGWLLLTVCCGSGLFWAAFLFRLLGVWCYDAPSECGYQPADAAQSGERRTAALLH